MSSKQIDRVRIPTEVLVTNKNTYSKFYYITSILSFDKLNKMYSELRECSVMGSTPSLGLGRGVRIAHFRQNFLASDFLFVNPILLSHLELIKRNVLYVE